MDENTTKKQFDGENKNYSIYVNLDGIDHVCLII